MNKQNLSESNQWLIEQCQRINFGRITFRVRAGEPDRNLPWRTRRTVKLAGGENGPRPESASDDFELRKEHLHLFDFLRKQPDGACVTVHVAHGLPGATIEIVQDYQAA